LICTAFVIKNNIFDQKAYLIQDYSPRLVMANLMIGFQRNLQHPYCQGQCPMSSHGDHSKTAVCVYYIKGMGPPPPHPTPDYVRGFAEIKVLLTVNSYFFICQ